MPTPKPLKIIGKKVKPVEVEVTPPKQGVLKLKKQRNTVEALRVQKTVHDILAHGKSRYQAQIDNGYSESSARAGTITHTKVWKEEVEKFIGELKAHRDEILAHMRKTYDKAPYAALSMTVDSLTKNIQLLSGKATGRIGFDLPPEQRSKIIDIIEKNAGN